jgi:hypothetical protein
MKKNHERIYNFLIEEIEKSEDKVQEDSTIETPEEKGILKLIIYILVTTLTQVGI